MGYKSGWNGDFHLPTFFHCLSLKNFCSVRTTVKNIFSFVSEMFDVRIFCALAEKHEKNWTQVGKFVFHITLDKNFIFFYQMLRRIRYKSRIFTDFKKSRDSASITWNFNETYSMKCFCTPCLGEFLYRIF